MTPHEFPFSSDPPPRSFVTTQWSMVIRAGRPDDSQAQSALAELCQQYWVPVHAFVRRKISNQEDARDLTQAFFVQLLEKNALAKADQARGKFRAFLLTAIQHFLVNEHERKQTQKRGAGTCLLTLDFESGESRLSFEPVHDETPERIYERQWVLSLLDTVLQRLQAEYAAADKSRTFELLRKAITAGESMNYREIASELQASEEAVRQMASRLRKRYRELLREEVAHTVDDPSEVDDEIRGLFASLSS